MSLFSFPSQVNEDAARLVAASVAVTALVAWATGAWFVVPFLAAGFLLRVGWGPRFSPFARAAMASAPRLREPKPVAGPPKRFAQGIGAAFTVTATVLFLLGHTTVAWGLVLTIVTFATLEAAFGFCLGCRVYALLQRVGVFPPDACVDCGPLR